MDGDTWTLTKTVSVKEYDDATGQSGWGTKAESWEFHDFGQARDAFRALARECATTEGGVFDGDGNIRNLQRYFDVMVENREEQMRDPKPNYMLGSMILRGAPEVAYMAGDFEAARAVPAALRGWLLDMGAYEESPLPEFRWTDWCLGIVSRPGSIAMGGIADEDRIELFDAQVYANAFDMSDPDGDYEFSARTGFDPYDTDPAALRIRLARGRGVSGGHFVWPEERDDWPAFFDEPAPCLEGAFDGNGGITVYVRPGRDGESALGERLAGGFEGFLDGVIEVAKAKRGLAVDVAERRRDPDGEWANARIRCYGTDEGCWFTLGIWARCELHPPKPNPTLARLGIEPPRRDSPPIGVHGWSGRHPGGSFEDYPEALAEVARLIDEHVENVGKPRDPAEERPEVVMIDIVCNFGPDGSTESRDE